MPVARNVWQPIFVLMPACFARRRIIRHASGWVIGSSESDRVVVAVKLAVGGDINAGESSTLTITLINPSTSIETLTLSFADNLPVGVTTVGAPSTTCGGMMPSATASSVALPAGTMIPAGSGPTAGFCTVTVDVTAAAGGSYLNTIGAGALVTAGVSNVALASATLAVIDTAATPPTLSKLFSPSVINERGTATLTITLCNPNSNPATLIAPLTDTLPDGAVIAATPNASTTCPGSGPVASTAGGTTVILPATRSIPASGCCTETVNVTAAAVGSFLNTLPTHALQSSNGGNTVPTHAILTVQPVSAPTLSRWALIMVTALLALVAFAAMRRQAM